MRQFFGVAVASVAILMPVGGALAGLTDRLPPAAYIDPTDQEIARAGKGIAGRPFPCAREKTERGIGVVEFVATDRCVKMSKPQNWRGIWRNDFEGSQFCAAPATPCSFYARGDRIWLTNGSVHGERGALYAIEFIGRKTVFKGPYGHMGVSDHELIVDRIISLKLVKPPPPPMSKAQFIAEMKRCEAAGTCIPSNEARALINGNK